MQWPQFALWVAFTFWASRKPRRAGWGTLAICLGLLVSMGTQLWLLWEVGGLSINTAVPLHLCSMAALLSIPMLLLRSRRLLSFSLLLGVPCAFLALCFPAIADSARPGLMASAFFRLHTLIFCAPLLLIWRGLPLRVNPRLALVSALAYMMAVSLFNAVLNTNYLFLRLAPAGTPLAWLAGQGRLGYVLSLVMCAMVLLTALSRGYEMLSAGREQESAAGHAPRRA